MRRTITILVFTVFGFSIHAQTTASFEDFNLPIDTFLNGSDMKGGFNDGNIFLPNDYNADWNSWSGWSISTTTDVTTPGFANQYSAITGKGNNNSRHYATGYVFGESIIELKGNAKGGTVEGFYITNATYTYLSMKDGDAFAKKFGGADGNDPDYLLLTIKKKLNGEVSSDSINFYLADFRDSDNSNDYIIKDWTYVDLTPLGKADELIFTMYSSDVGQFGINTPTYFCIDDFTTLDDISAVNNLDSDPAIEIYPNPVVDFVNIHSNVKNGTARLYDMNGKNIKSIELSIGDNYLSLTALPRGVYSVLVENEGTITGKKIIKQ